MQHIIDKAVDSKNIFGITLNVSSNMMIFLQAFFKGDIFPKKYILELSNWNNGFFPIQFGAGLMRFKLPWIFSLFNPVPNLVGHSGLSGAFAYYSPKKDIYITGTVNQIDKPATSYKLMLKILNSI